MQGDLSSPLKTIEFFIKSNNSEQNIHDLDTSIKTIDGVNSVEVNAVSGQTKIVLKNSSDFDKKFIEIQRKIFKLGYEIKNNNTNGVQGVLFFGTMILGFLFVAVVMILFYYFGSLPSLV